MKKSTPIAAGIGLLVLIGLIVLVKKSSAGGTKFSVGDVINIGEDIYTVHGVDSSKKQYLLFKGRYPNDTFGDWSDSNYIDNIASRIAHVNIVYAE